MRLIPSAFKTKKFLFTFMTLIAVVLVIESISYLTLAMMNRNVFPLSQIYPERAARIVDAGQDTRPAGEVIHPYLGFVYNPEANSDDSLRGHANVPISEYGFLDHADPIHGKSEGRLILGIFGGSVAFWLSVHGIDSLISELMKYPAYSSKEIVVVRVALGGYKQPQQLMALNYLLVLGGEFDIIVNVDGFNEVALPPAENIPKHVAPFFPRNWYMRVQNSSDYFVSLTSGKITYLESRRSRWAALLSRAPVRYSSAFALLWKLVDTRLARQVGRNQLALQRYAPSDARYVASGPYYQGDDAELFEELAGVWKRSSLQMHELCEANGIRYFHFLQPNQYVPDSKRLGEEERETAFTADHPYRRGVEKGYPFLVQSGRELSRRGIRFHDLTMTFSDTDEQIYIDDCCHYNEKGNEILGAVIGQTIVEGMATE